MSFIYHELLGIQAPIIKYIAIRCSKVKNLVPTSDQYYVLYTTIVYWAIYVLSLRHLEVNITMFAFLANFCDFCALLMPLVYVSTPWSNDLAKNISSSRKWNYNRYLTANLLLNTTTKHVIKTNGSCLKDTTTLQRQVHIRTLPTLMYLVAVRQL